jgi:hypothetical protein
MITAALSMTIEYAIAGEYPTDIKSTDVAAVKNVVKNVARMIGINNLNGIRFLL